MPNMSAKAWLDQAKSCFNNGEFFRAYDNALAGLVEFPGDEHLAHRAVLALANAGATKLAAEKFESFGLARSAASDVRALSARIKKDEAFQQSGEVRQQLLRESRALYEAIYRDTPVESDAYYPAINAATTALLAGDDADATSLANEVIALLGPRIDECLNNTRDDQYWVLATAVEAYLILGDAESARRLVRSFVVSCGTQQSESLVVVEPGGHVGRSLAGLSTCPRGGSSQRLS
jgi:hypothetical protein